MDSLPAPPPLDATTELVAPEADVRQSTVRFDEWRLYRKGLQVVESALDRLLANPPRDITLPHVSRFLEVVNRLGRITSGLGYDAVEEHAPVNAHLMIEVDAILARIYGPSPAGNPTGSQNSSPNTPPETP